MAKKKVDAEVETTEEVVLVNQLICILTDEIKPSKGKEVIIQSLIVS